jgi:hypothetical protein
MVCSGKLMPVISSFGRSVCCRGNVNGVAHLSRRLPSISPLTMMMNLFARSRS